MGVEVYRGWFIVGSLALMLMAATPTLAMFIRLPSGSERFSELWLLGPGHKAEDYPFNVEVDKTYSVYVGVGNRLGYSAYYMVYVKFRNQTQPLPIDSNATPSALPTLYEFNFFVRYGEVWETLLNFRILDAELFSENGKNFTSVNNLAINEIPSRVDSLSVWDEARNGFYYQLFFELWLYNMTTQSFQYHNRFVAIWLNMTS